MDTLYAARLHGFPNLTRGGTEPALTEQSVLSLLIVLGSSLSLVALVFAFITYSLFSDLRNLSGTTLMNLLSALFMSQILHVVGVGGVMDSELCIAMAFALQYVRLCVFTWMLLMTHNMYSQFKTGLHLVPVNDDDIGSKFIRYSLFGWGVPSLLLLASISTQYYERAGNLLDTKGMKERNCWFLDDDAFVYGSVLPSGAFAAATFYYLLRSTVLSRYIVGMQTDKRIRDKMRRKRTLQIILFTKIAIVLSMVLTLSALTKLIPSDAIWISFHVVQGLQGILVALLVTCNCQVLKLYASSIRKRAAKHVPSYIGLTKTAAPNASTSLQLLAWDPPPDLV
ncbi:cadherin EGF LAG seven-pass G-type receptor 1-like [Cylas formicarius]|uniref:cadherin EGF LAG seven-pass G-type receptor 1-like n=1 Tax=Cylas formicarius TaxID=197179 RepID=UPI002958A5B2|nr:cadherin EGF LAG seven-pass G-type receptor 1-like [Cylas formicarius]